MGAKESSLPILEGALKERPTDCEPGISVGYSEGLLISDQYEPSPIRDAELSINAMKMSFNGAFSQAQLVGYDFVGKAL